MNGLFDPQQKLYLLMVNLLFDKGFRSSLASGPWSFFRLGVFHLAFKSHDGCERALGRHICRTIDIVKIKGC